MVNTLDRAQNTKRSGFGDPSYRKLSHLLDSSIPLPGGFRIGLDGIIGLIPGIGDAASSLLSTMILYQAYQRGIPRLVLFRMILNLLIDTTIGAIPVLGDLFDFYWKANLKNARLIEAYEANPKGVRRRSAIAAAAVFMCVLLVLGAAFYVALLLLRFLWQQMN